MKIQRNDTEVCYIYPAHFSQPVKVRVANSGSCFVRTNESKVARRTYLTEWQKIRKQCVKNRTDLRKIFKNLFHFARYRNGHLVKQNRLPSPSSLLKRKTRVPETVVFSAFVSQPRLVAR